MNSKNGGVSIEMAIFNLPPEVLIFINWALINENQFNFSPGSIAIGPLDYNIIYKTVLGFWIIQFGH